MRGVRIAAALEQGGAGDSERPNIKDGRLMTDDGICPRTFQLDKHEGNKIGVWWHRAAGIRKLAVAGSLVNSFASNEIQRWASVRP